MTSPLVVRNCEVGGRPMCDVLIDEGTIAAIGVRRPRVGRADAVIDAGGGALVPGLHDHHLHLFGEAARRTSVACGPPGVSSADGLGRVLRRATSSLPAGAWLRGTGYDSRAIGVLDRSRLDALAGDRRVRIQERTGTHWALNSAALRALELETTCPEGVLVRGDRLLAERLGRRPPSITAVLADLMQAGVTGVTDATPGNMAADIDQLRLAVESSGCRIQVFAMAGPDGREDRLALPVVKLVIDEDSLDVDGLAGSIAAAHHAGCRAAVHAVTRAEVVAAVAAFDSAGTVPGDRLEHAAVVASETVAAVARLGLTVVAQPAFVAERGDVYLADAEGDDADSLYRLRTWLEARVALAAGSDAPVGSLDPWAAMRAAVDRRAPDGTPVAPAEALSPAQALGLFLGRPLAPGDRRRVEPGEAADLCLLSEPWDVARRQLDASLVRATIVAGTVVWEA